MIPPLDDSALALESLSLGAGLTGALDADGADRLLFTSSGRALLTVGADSAHLGPGSAALVPAGARGAIEASEELEAVVATVSAGTDLHAPLGRPQLAVSLDAAGSEQATGARSFQILFGPHNGSTRATLFAGFIPPGKAPWHYHLYDEIVWVPEGPGRLHLEGRTQELGPGAAFRLRPRQVHIVENLGDTELTILGVFTPAGSPSAAYLEPGVAADYRFSE